MTTKQRLLNEFAILNHIQWRKWNEYLFNKCVENPDGSYTIPKDVVVWITMQDNLECDDLPRPIRAARFYAAQEYMSTIDKVFTFNKREQ